MASSSIESYQTSIVLSKTEVKSLTRSVFWVPILADIGQIPILQLKVNWILKWQIQNGGKNFFSLWHVTGLYDLLHDGIVQGIYR